VEAHDGVDISCDDLQVVGCGMSGVRAYNATITLSGQGTRIQGNGTGGGSYSYGLDAYTSSSKIKLFAPLTGGGGNWGRAGTLSRLTMVAL